MTRLLGTVLTLALLGTIPAAWAGDAKRGDITITNAWARATPPQPPVGGAFMTVSNGGAQSDHLVAARSPVAKTVELHTHVKDGAVMRMTPLSRVEVPPGQTVAFAPGGLHVMLIGLAAPLKEGSRFPLELDFANAGTVTVSVDVAKVGAAGPANPGMANPGMAHDPAMHEQHMKDPATRAMHESHMADPAHREMHDKMHGK